MSDSPSSSCTTGTGLDQVAPPSVDFTTMSWESKSKAWFHAASFCPLMKWTYTVPFEATIGRPNWSSSHSFAGPVDWNVQLACEPEISLPADQVRPPSSDQLR